MNSQFKEIDNKTLKKLREVQIEILDEIDRICKKNNIQYFLFAGTLLGAVRHSGFIPWDDDLDIAMLRDDYEKFIEACYNDLDCKYYLDSAETNKKFNFAFAKVRKNNTTFNEEAISNLDIHKGIFVDVFPLDFADSNFKKCFLKGFIIKNLVETIFLKRGIYDIKQCRHPMFVKISCIFSVDIIYKFIKFIATSCNKKNKDNLVSFYGVYSLKKEYFTYDTFFPAKMVKFNGKLYPGPNDSHKYLTSLYGNYMKLPPKDKRVNHKALYINFEEGKNISYEK